MIIYTPTSKRQIDIQLKAINAVFLNFEKKFLKITKELNIYGISNRGDKLLHNRYTKLKKNFEHVLHVLNFCLTNKISLRKYYERNRKSAPISKRHFFREKIKLCKLCDKRLIEFKLHLPKTPIPKTITYKYSHRERQQICNFFYKNVLDTNSLLNKTNLWLQIKKLNIKFEKMSYTTLLKIVNEDDRRLKRKDKPLAKPHLFRRKPKKLGIIQLDLKILGTKESKLGKKVAVFDAIDTSSRLVYSNVLEYQTNYELMKSMNKMNDFFSKNNIQIKRIQTDNAMQFKNTNFVKSNQFNKWCNDRKIIHTFIPYQQPECNGCIERYHRTIDQELGKILKKCTNLDQVKIAFDRWIDYYNNTRLLHYTELDEISKENRFMTPIQSISYFDSYNNIV